MTLISGKNKADLSGYDPEYPHEKEAAGSPINSRAKSR